MIDTCARLVMRFSYRMYGVRLSIEMPLGFPPDPSDCENDDALADVRFVEADDVDFVGFPSARTPSENFVCDNVPGRGTYLRWPRFFEFSVSANGSRVACRPIAGCDPSVFQHFLFGQVLAVALVRQGIEPLHAAVIAIDDAAVALLGDCTYGKSTLLASFAEAGHRVVSDDMLILDRRAGELHALPGSGRVKLMPDSAEYFRMRAVGTRLTPVTEKRSFPLDASIRQRTPLPLRALYALPAPDERAASRSLGIRPISRADAVRDVLKNTFTIHIVDHARLTRQLDRAADVAASIDAFRLAYPAGLDHVAAVRQAIVEHFRRVAGTAALTTETT